MSHSAAAGHVYHSLTLIGATVIASQRSARSAAR
jgi:hypothetical protein